MKRILGLDLGTNSIGWAVVNRYTEKVETNGLWRNEEHHDLQDKGVLIFSEGVKIEKGNESSKAAERTGYRSARKIKFRRKLRKYETLKVLIKEGMCPLTIEELEHWKSSINPENGKKRSFKHYPSSNAFREWLHTDNEGDKTERKKQRKNPYYLRAKALDEKLTKEELGRVFYHFAQRRGFLSNRLDSSDMSELEKLMPEIQQLLNLSVSLEELESELEEFFENYDLTQEEFKGVKTLRNSFLGTIKNNRSLPFEELKERLDKRLNKKDDLGKVKGGISELSEEISEGGFRTMGEYFYSLYTDAKPIRKRYTAREEHYLHEFHEICKAQNVNDALKKELEDAIFFQRPLKSQKGTVGKCSFEPSKSRCPVSHPDFEAFRMYAFLNNIKIKTPEDEKLRFLNEKEREKALGRFALKKPNFPFEEIAKAIAPKNDYAYYKGKDAGNKGYLFNYQMNATVAGCPVTARLKDVFGCELEDIHVTYTAKNGKGETVNKAVDYRDLWHVLFSFDSNERLVAYAKDKLGLSDKKANAFAAIRLKKDYAALSLKAINGILPYLKKGLLYSHAVFMAKLPDIIDVDKWKGNEDFLKGAIKDVIDNDKEDNRRVNLINDLLASYKEQYPNKHDSAHQLDAIDHQMVADKLIEVYGNKGLEAMNEERRKELVSDVEAKYLSCIRTGKFLPKKRLDEKVLDLIKDNSLCSDESRLQRLYHPSDIDTYPDAERAADGKLYLGSPMTNSVRNPMAMRSLHQLRKLINTLIKEDIIDEETIIHIELSRELNDANKRKAIQKWQKRLEDEKAANRKEIAILYEKECGKSITPNEDDVLKYKLWLEQGKKCIYTNKTISVCDFVGSDPKFDIEHTLPRSISEDNSDMNKTLCDREYNREVKKNRIPADCPNHDDILENVQHWKDQYEALDRQIEAVSRAVKASTTKEAKDARIEKRHLLRLERDYLHGKYERFAMKEVKSGFKNSQKVDIGIISKLSRAFLASLFPKVYSVKGSMVDQFRKAWGLHEFAKDENGNYLHDANSERIYLPKDRSNHTHHCQDAVVIACMSKQKYDVLASAWRKEEDGNIKAAKAILEAAKPWKGFTENVKALRDEVLVVHHSPDNVGKASKRKRRKRGKIDKDKNGKVVYLQGDSARGSLHKDTFYGAILRPANKDVNKPTLDKDGNVVEKVFYVVRKEISGLKDNELENIVDEKVKEIVKAARNTENALNKEIAELNKLRKKAEEEELAAIDAQIKAIKLRIENDLYRIPPREGKTQFTPIKKVRVYQPTVTDPIHLKPHSHVSRHAHKANYHVMNDGNHLFAVYEGTDKNGKIIRDFTILNMLEASNGMAVSEVSPKGLKLKFKLTKGILALFYENHPDELKGLSTKQLSARMYQLVKFDKSGRLYFRPHTEARAASDLKEKSSIDLDSPWEQIVLTRNSWNFLASGEGFEISRSGQITFDF
ncbi:MAG: type II CRISPR RNA-guided endonuclease Cas9 [Flavobacteriales bacterium]|nr:type II CRISPR RNA-guided endonuclease Cas9 [Flavobacteriales bacterium]